MTDYNILILFCLLDGEDHFFQVRASPGDSVLDLKEKIRTVKAGALQGVDANQIVLLKVSYCCASGSLLA
jgi:Crinkler effector protein N-terminal domain